MTWSNKIFIGSSNEAEPLARAVGDLIDEHEGTEAVLWSAVFPAGVILLEHIERMPNEIAGACTRGDSRFGMPQKRDFLFLRHQLPTLSSINAYLSARLGRKRVSILQIDDVDMPSDLQGVRLIKDNQRRYQKGAAFPLLDSTKTDLWRWLDQLPRLTPRLPAISQVHGVLWNLECAKPVHPLA